MTFGERQELRRRLDAAARRRVYGRCEILGYINPETGYKHGCRCDYCRQGTANARRLRKRRREARAAE